MVEAYKDADVMRVMAIKAFRVFKPVGFFSRTMSRTTHTLFASTCHVRE